MGFNPQRGGELGLIADGRAWTAVLALASDDELLVLRLFDARGIPAEDGQGRVRQAWEDRMKAARGELSFWEYDEKGFIIAGTPKRVRERLRELATSLRVGQLIPTLHMGNLPEETAAKNTELFGREVIPYLRDLWADQPDHWTPQVSQQRVAANAPAPAGVSR